MSAELIESIQQGKFESWDAERLLGWAVEQFHPRLVLSASFGAPEGIVLLDMMHRIEPGLRVFTLDTGRLPQATHDLIDRVRDRYGIASRSCSRIEREVAEMVRRGGQNLFYESVEKRQLCCRIRKVEPMKRYFASAGVDAWVAGLRRSQGVTREEAAKIEIDEKHGGLVKFNPLVDWTLEQVWDYVREHNVPVNRLHKQGYPVRRLRSLLARDPAGRRHPRRPLVVGESGDEGVRDPRRRGIPWLGHLTTPTEQ